MKMFVKFVSLLTLFSFILFTSSAYAEETVSPIKIGQIAPYSGMLVSSAAIARIISDIQTQPEITAAEIKRAVDTVKAEDQIKLDTLNSKIAYMQTTSEASIKARESQIAALQKQLAAVDRSKPNVPLWTGIGAVSGVIVTILTVFAVTQVTK